MATTKTDKILRLKTQQGRTMQIVREHYLREDVPCYSSICVTDCSTKQDSKLSTLLCDTTHYIVPDCQVAKQWLEILEYPELTGIIFFQTVVHSVQHEGSRKHHKRILKLVADPLKRSIVFYNEFQKYAYCPRKPKEPLTDWQNRSVHSAASWYYNHLAGQKPIIILSQDSRMKEVYGSTQVGVHVYNLEEYLKKFWPNLPMALDLLESLTASLEDATGKDKEYKGYLPGDVLESGLKNGKFIQGCLQVNKHNAQQEAFLRRTGHSSKEGNQSSDILIRGMSARNRAVHGDTVVVQVLPPSQWTGRSVALSQNNNNETKEDQEDEGHVMPCGQIVGVLQRNWREYVCSFAENEDSQSQQKKAGKVLVVPMDWRIPKIRISTRQADTLRNHRILARIDNWEVGSQYPNGHFVRSLGPIGELETEIAAILVEYSISVTPFSEGQMKELPSNTKDNPWKMEKEEVEARRDLRESHLIFSIDPKGCEDVDDTLSVRELSNGHVELGVHIADVTAFVQPNTLTDLEARSRSTTVYLADRRYDMLPAVLSADLCSLISGVDRYAMSVIWELDKDYKVVDVWYGRTIIRSAYKLFYEIAQQIHDRASDEEVIANVPELQNLSSVDQQSRLPLLRKSVNNLMEIARKLKSYRTREGALELEGSEVTIQMDKSKEEIQDLIPKQSLEIHETIAECMIHANHWVAKKIYESFPSQGLLRHHPLPRAEHFENLIHCAGARGFEVKTTSNKSLAESLDGCVDQTDPSVNKILRSLATQAMSNAAYFSTGSLAQDQYFHYGLALDYYTHFTSPIRRYADVIVHRILLAAIKTTDSNQLLSNKDLNDLCSHINKKHRAAQNAQKESIELFQTLFFKDKSDSDESRVVDAVVFQLRANGVLVFIPRYGIKGAVYLRSKEGLVVHVGSGSVCEWTSGTIEKTDTQISVTSVYGFQIYRLLDHLTVKITVQESRLHACSLKLELISNKPHTATFPSDVKGQKAEIIKEVTQSSGEQHVLDTTALGPDFNQWKSQYGQTAKKNSLYSLMQSLYEYGLKNV